jgi:large subunit ribosomal protein L19
MDALIDAYDGEQLKQDVPEFDIGDTVRVSTRIIEGEKERVQVFQGTVIARKGRGLSETFSLHRVSYGEGMERVFYMHSPRIVKIQIVKKGDVRRSKLYYLRGRTGKKAKVKEKIGANKKTQRVEFEFNQHDTERSVQLSVSETVEGASEE